MKPRQNEFYGAVIGESVIKEHYVKSPDFDHFVFQQWIKDADDSPNDKYFINVYAINKKGKVMDKSPLPLTILSQQGLSLKANKMVEFANALLDGDMLKKLYPDKKAITDLTVWPSEYYEETGYVVYSAQPNYTEDGSAPPVVKLNPSPPA